MNGSISFNGSLIGDITGGGGGGGDTVIITPVVTSGTKIADVSVNGVEKDLYCPTPPTPTEVEVTPVVSSGTKIADVSVNGVEKDLYCPTAPEIEITPVVTSGTKIAIIEVNGVNNDIFAPSGVGGHVYSINEHIVGIWIDGRDVYEKTIPFGVISEQSYSLDLNLLSSEIDFCFLVSDASYINHGTLPIPYVHGVDSNNNIGGFFNYNNTNVSFDFRIGQNSAGYITDGIVTIRYVKKATT